MWKSLVWGAACVALVACGDDDDGGSDAGMSDGGMMTTDGGGDVDAGREVDGGGDVDGGGGGWDIGPAPTCADLPEPPDVTCDPLETDYSVDADDMWPECVSDGGEYVRIQDTISSIARIAAFEDIAEMIFDRTSDPDSEAFLATRMIYQEDEGLDSRVARRYDPRFEVPDGTDCTVMEQAEMYPEYCVGPAILQPEILAAFAEGFEAEGDTPTRLYAARIEAALLWFLYASTNKEAFSCTNTAKDCDSSYAYYTGGADAREGDGLARYVSEADAEAHDRAWDGIFAVRCWRDIDDADTATMLELRDRARAQLDRAVTHGVAAVLRERVEAMCSLSGAELGYEWEFVTTLAPALDATAMEADATMAEVLRTELSRATPGDVDVAAVLGALDALYPCP